MSFPTQPPSRCDVCGDTNDRVRMGLVRVGEVVDGRIVFSRKECCPRCVSACAVLLPSRTIQAMTEDAIAQTHKTVKRFLAEEATRAITHKAAEQAAIHTHTDEAT
jgi:hypothetical protein